MRYNELNSYLQNLTKEVKPYDMANALDCTTSKITYRRDHNGNFTAEEVNKIEKYLQNKYNITTICDTNEEFLVDYYPDVFGSCGTGVFEISEVKEKMSVPMKIVECYDKTKQYSVINAYGDSMQPFIEDGDMLVVEHQENDFIIDSRIYVFRYGEEIFIKRLVKNINQVVIKSDNKDYSPITLFGEDLKNFQIIGRIVGMMRRL